ncbi:MAG: hypothetical protein ACHP6H_03180 [Legionellales bacterium]
MKTIGLFVSKYNKRVLVLGVLAVALFGSNVSESGVFSFLYTQNSYQTPQKNTVCSNKLVVTTCTNQPADQCKGSVVQVNDMSVLCSVVCTDQDAFGNCKHKGCGLTANACTVKQTMTAASFWGTVLNAKH